MKRRTSRAVHLGTKSGAGLRPTPRARSSARVTATSGAGAPFSASLRRCQCREQRKPSSPARVLTRKDTHKQEGNFGQTPVVAAVAVVGGWWFGLVWFGLVWFGLVWFGLVWFGLVWFGLVWFGLVWFGLVWFGLVRFGSVRFGSVRFGSVRFGSVRFGSVRFGLVWFGLVWFGLVWFGLVWFGLVWFGLVVCCLLLLFLTRSYTMVSMATSDGNELA